MKTLEEYKKKRHFNITPEPIPESEDTALLSYAIPKARMPEENEKLLAINTELHPIEYINFEGIIPPSEYGAGRVKIYDSGDYEILDINDKRMIIYLNGKKIKGKYAIIHQYDDKYLITKLKDE